MYFAIPLVLGIAALVFIVNVILPFYPQRMVTIGLTYFILISSMMLSAAVLYASEQKLIILGSILAGTLAVAFGMEVLDWDLPITMVRNWNNYRISDNLYNNILSI